ncbi:hypothetical protein Tco_0666160 [Tanacetum coccineum]
MSNRHQELTSPEQTAPALASPEQTATAMASPKQTAIGKDSSNPFMAGSLPKTTPCVIFLEFCDKHNMVAYLEKSTGSAGFHQIIDFITRSHIYYALTKKPTEVIHEQEGSGKASDEVSTAGKKKYTASEEVPPISTAEVHISTAGGTVTYSRRSAEKRTRQDKGKAILIEEDQE